MEFKDDDTEIIYLNSLPKTLFFYLSLTRDFNNSSLVIINK